MKFRFRAGQEVRVNPRYHKEAWAYFQLQPDRIYRVDAVDPRLNRVMFMGVVENWVNADILMPLKPMSLKKWLKLMNSSDTRGR